ncbi:MAG: ROK family protein [Acidobacteria bacterium]|nr:ROK family protein [Acidobacteriota bacterium]
MAGVDEVGDEPMVAEGPVVLGIDIGGTKVAAGLVDSRGHLVRWTSAESRPDLAPAEMAETVVEQAEALLAELGVEPDRVAAVGIGFPGDFAPETGQLITAPNLPAWVGAAPEPLFRGILERRWGQSPRIVADNDACVAALAEATAGAGQGVDRLLYITVSTGIGGGRYDHGRLTNIEPGLKTHPDPAHPEINLETFAAGPGIARRAAAEIRAYLDLHDPSELSRLTAVFDGDEAVPGATLDERIEHLTARHLGAAAARGDAFCRSLFTWSARILAAGLAIRLEDGFGEQRIVIGGSVAAKTPGYVDQVRFELHRLRDLPGAGPGLRAFDPEQVVESGLDDERGALGAAALALRTGR